MAIRNVIKLVGGVLQAVPSRSASESEVEVMYRSIVFNGGSKDDALFPEVRYLPPRGPQTLGVAISGGGTRSASAALGQLRGLSANGWLNRVRYLSAVSGGAWAATPFTFTGDVDAFLGQARSPHEIRDDATLKATGGPACFAHSIADSGVVLPGLRAALPQIVNKVVDRAGDKDEALGASLESVIEAGRDLLRRQQLTGIVTRESATFAWIRRVHRRNAAGKTRLDGGLLKRCHFGL